MHFVMLLAIMSGDDKGAYVASNQRTKVSLGPDTAHDPHATLTLF
jgi:hypothetical protein